MTRCMMMLVVLVGMALAGCANDGAKKERPTGPYEQVSPFETGEDPFEVR